jgi:hypothetical protein
VRTRLLLTVPLIAAMLAVLPAAASAKLKSETASSGPVSAVLTYNVGPGFVFDVTGTHLAITNAGAKLLDIDVPEPCKGCGIAPAGAGGGTAKSLQVADLDGDGQPEVLLDIYTGGAHCCLDTWIYRLSGSSYIGTPAQWGDPGYGLKDLNGDGIPELRSADDRFAYEFTSFAESWLPPMVMQFRAGKLTDVTRRFPGAVRADIKRILRVYNSKNRRKFDLRGAVAAYVADQCLLGHCSTGWKLVRSARRQGLVNGLGKGDPWPRGARYVKALRKFLKHNGYLS